MKTRHACLKLSALVFCTTAVHAAAQSGVVQFTGKVVKPASASMAFTQQLLTRYENEWRTHSLSEATNLGSIDLLDHFANYASADAKLISVTYK